MIYHLQALKDLHDKIPTISQPFRHIYNEKKDLYLSEMAKILPEDDNFKISSEKLFNDITEIENNIILDKSEISKLDQLNADKLKSIDELRKLYLSEFEKRKETASKLSEGNYVKLEIDISGDTDHFLNNVVNKYLLKRQTLNMQHISEFIDYIQKTHISKNIPFTYELLTLIENNNILDIINQYDTTPNKKSELIRIFNDTKFIYELETYQIPNKINILVKKGENNYISITQASYGEKALAIISIILSELNNRHIIIMDTPDEGIDSKCVYDYLVKQIKEMKQKKQIIIITHNANIPVIADAENIIVLSVDNTADANKLVDKAGNALHDNIKFKLQEKIISKNIDKIKSYISSLKLQNINVFEDDILEKINTDKSLLYGKILKSGGLDRDEIKFQVCEIMEGSEEAFKFRKEKYGF